MQEVSTFFDNPTVNLIFWALGALGWVVGIISGWIQVQSYREQKRLEGAYRHLLEQARRDWRGRYTEEQIEELTKDFQRLQTQISEKSRCKHARSS